MKYYSTQRPVMPGGYPKSQKVLDIGNFDSRQYVESIGRMAWGWIEYAQPLSEKDAADYELVAEPGEQQSQTLPLLQAPFSTAPNS